MCYFSLPQTLKALLDKKVEVNCENLEGRTPAMMIFSWGKNKDVIVKNLIECLNLLKIQPNIDFIKKDNNGNSLINYVFEFYKKLSDKEKLTLEEHVIDLKIKIKNQVLYQIKNKKFDCNEYVGFGIKPIHLACFDSDYDMISFLLDEKCDVNALSAEGWITPLMFLFSWKSKNINLENVMQCANLLVRTNGIDLVKRDIKNRSLIDHVDDFYNLLNENEKKIFEIFLNEIRIKVECQIETQGSDGEFFVLIHELIEKNKEDRAVTYIENRKEFKKDFQNDDGWTMLNLACYFKRPKIIQALVNKGSDPNVGSSTGIAPLFSLFFDIENCMFSCFFQAVENFLVSSRIDFFKLSCKNQLIIGFLLILKNNMIFKDANKNHIEMIDLIINKIIIRLANQIFEKIEKDEQSVDWLNITGEPALYWACHSNDQEKINFLIEKGADVNQANIAGETLLMRIFSEKNIENIDVVDSALLLVNQVKINFLLLSKINYLLVDYFFIYKSNFKGESREKINILEKLIYEKTAQQVFEKIQEGNYSWLNFKLSVTGDTLFHLAGYANNDDLVKFFLKKNADINALSNYGCTPLRAIRCTHLLRQKPALILKFKFLQSTQHSNWTGRAFTAIPIPST